MGAGGKIQIKGGIASHNEAEVIDGALLVTTGDGTVPGGGFLDVQRQWGSSGASGITNLILTGVTSFQFSEPITRRMKTARVAVRIRRDTTPAPAGDWTLTLFRNGSAEATFTVAMS
jgi:hypothetical protein